MNAIVFPHSEIEYVWDRQFYVPAGLNPWDTPCSFGDASGTVMLQCEPCDALTVPFDGDTNYERHIAMVKGIKDAIASDDMQGVREAFNMIVDVGIKCTSVVENGPTTTFYVSKPQLTIKPTMGGRIYCQSQVRMMDSDGKRNPVYHLMTETELDDGRILWRFKINTGEGAKS